MNRPLVLATLILAVAVAASGFASAAATTSKRKPRTRPASASAPASAPATAPLPWIKLSADKSGFERAGVAGEKVVPWGFNYDRDHKLRLLEDYWDEDWSVVEEDFREIKDLGANVVRVHLQFGKFMNGPTEPNAENLARLEKLVRLAEDSGLYLDVTGLASYRKRDVPKWYDALDEAARWDAQANFWAAIARTLADRPGVFCYNLINEPVIPAQKLDHWLHPFALAGFHYVQHIVLDPVGRDPNVIAQQWTRKMTAAVRRHDKRRLVTVGMLPIKPADAKSSRGFVPAALKDDLDFLAVHLYPESKKSDEAMATLKLFDVGKPLVIEEIFPLTTTPKELGEFITESRSIADGWIGFYWGKTVEEMEDEPGPVDKAMLGWLDLFKKLHPAAAPATAESAKR